MVKKNLFLLLFIFCAIPIFADTWEDPKIITTYSQNGQYMLKFYPRSYPADYWTSRYRRQLKKGIVKDTIVPCHAELYNICKSDTIKLMSVNVPFANYLSPVEAIVANDGKSFVTFDQWGGAGRRHTFVIYGENGIMIADFSLEDISPFPLEEYRETISSIHWRGGAEYLDNNRLKIDFKNEKEEIRSRIFNIKQIEFE